MTPRISRAWGEMAGSWTQSGWPSPLATRTNARRRRVFIATLVVALAVTQGYTWLRPAQYRASARVEITPALEAPPSLPTSAGGSVVIAPGPTAQSDRPFLTEVQVLTSRPIVEAAVKTLERAGENPEASERDRIGWAQSHLEAIPVTGTNIVEVAAAGPTPAPIASLVNAVIDAYGDALAEAYRSASEQAVAQINDEVAKLEVTLAEKRRAVEAFRVKHSIISLERQENEALAQVRNSSQSLGTANERVATAEGKLRALREAHDAGRSSTQAKDDPTLAHLEQRAAQMREELGELERGFTPLYLEREPKAVALRARIADLERQIVSQRDAGQKVALAKAQEELASAQGALSQVQRQLASGREQASQFTTHFNEYKLQQEALTDVETAYRDALQRRTRLEASARARMPTLVIIERAGTPQQPWRPLYGRDSAIGAAISLVVALLVMWLVELFNKVEPQPAVVVVQPTGLGHAELPIALGAHHSPGSLSGPGTRPLLPGAPLPLPRELRADEVSALLAAADAETKMIVLLLLSGVRVDEIPALHWRDIDPTANRIRIAGDSPRDVVVNPSLQTLLYAQSGHPADAPLIEPSPRDSIDARILCAAHDAAIADAAEINAECIRHTYIAFLVRSQLRFADLARIVGPLSPELLRAYSLLSPSGARLGLDAVDATHPAAREHAVKER